jgi:Cu/Ag efflux pump CusA
MAVAVIFGLAVATLLTLVVVPVLYSISETASIKGAISAISGMFKRQAAES